MTDTPASTLDMGTGDMERGNLNKLSHQKSSQSNHPNRKMKLDHASLPSPASYLASQGLLQGHRGGWAMIRCPVHKSGQEKHPSMSVSLDKGNFKCFACGAKGGDIVDLHRLISGSDFLTTVKHLGGRLYA
jgi:hypothetical protein